MSDLATWLHTITILKLDTKHGINSSYLSYGHPSSKSGELSKLTPIGSMITHMINALAWEDHTLRGWAEHLELIGGPRAAAGFGRMWDSEILSETVRAKKLSNPPTRERWDEWKNQFS